jgi:hypothetical protein
VVVVQGEARKLFNRLEVRGTAGLSPLQVAELLVRLLPAFSPRELRYALTEVLALDSSKSGQISWNMFLRSSRGVKPMLTERSPHQIVSPLLH